MILLCFSVVTKQEGCYIERHEMKLNKHEQGKNHGSINSNHLGNNRSRNRLGMGQKSNTDIEEKQK